MINSIKTYLNNNKAALAHHDGYKDTDCQYHSNHLHIMVVQQKKQHICMNYDYKKLQVVLRPGATVLSQKVRVPAAFAGYLTKPPKTFLGTNSNHIKLLLAEDQQYKATKAIEGPTEEHNQSTTRQTSKEKKPKMYNDIDLLLQLMKKYATADKIQLLRETTASQDKNDQDSMKDLIRLTNWNIVYKKAQAEYDFLTTLKQDENYYHTFLTAVDDSRQKTMTHQQTVDFFNDWTQEQNIDILKFILEVYSIMRMYHQKKNCLYLQGLSNAGKTFVLESLLPHKDKVGQHITSRDFCFQECLTKPVIMINELTIQNQGEAEQYKNILGGEPTYINIKNRNAELLYRKPVFLTSNLPIWRFVSNDRQPLLNRMFSYMNLSTSQVIKKYTQYGVPSTNFWRTAFLNISELETALNIPSNENFLNYKPEFQKYLTKDAQSITDTDILLQNLQKCPLSLVPGPSNQQQETETTTDSITIMATEPPTTDFADKSGQTGMSLMDTTPIPPTKMLPANKREETTQTQKIQEIHYYDVQKDDKENPMSEANINNNAAHNSDNETPDEQEDS